MQIEINAKTVKANLPNKLLKWLNKVYRELDCKKVSSDDVIMDIYKGNFNWKDVELHPRTQQELDVYVNEARRENM